MSEAHLHKCLDELITFKCARVECVVKIKRVTTGKEEKNIRRGKGVSVLPLESRPFFIHRFTKSRYRGMVLAAFSQSYK